ncbi:NAD(P)-dependent alcohol dehydrogenase [Arthrobacter sp. zg-Y1171]|uniref:NAD(P)-dependent alcohol dehydrogenase n=1 Tax=Arthrobacter sp. zg-Y1171 TaxID=2964610 RepID=UPI002106A8A4|nr:NAD(P)-dependent alcohol dehydrogenase [Arthrobacter sp. zg-Y1171]MCQ1993833.1 NAD(P)-dependent alcohol dehydrogenase [Arthrobacter sp. zg-Y1171]UWX82038.1 NAD(P)-dependent alcohol dehydrogenase [Arthrobacter sp. zg-Y1171]
MTSTATAAVLRGTNRPFELAEVTLDDPRPDEVLVRVVASGVCGTDLGVQAGHIPFPLPGVLGHEGAGVVEAVGSAVTSVQPGDHVLLTFTSCGVCRNCRSAHPAYCVEFLSRNLLGGERADGSSTLSENGTDLHGHFFAQSSFSNLVLADERGVTKVDPAADLSLLAPLGCGIQTGAGAVLNVLKPEPGSVLAVFGAGPVGLAAVMAAALSPATRIIVMDLVDSRLELARELGATDVVNSGNTDAVQALMELTGGQGVTHALETTGSVKVAETAASVLAPLGKLGLIGAPAAGSTMSLDVNFMLNGRQILGITEGDSNPQLFLPALVDLVQQGRFPLEKMITRYSFRDINEAAAAAKSGSVLKPVLHFEDLV